MKELTEKKDLDMIINENSVVVIDYWAEWCGPCKRIAPMYSELDEKFKDVVFVKVNVDESVDITENTEIKCLPTFHIFKNNEHVETIEGSKIEEITNAIEKHVLNI